MENKIEENIAKNLIELRKEHNLTQAEMAQKIGYSDKTISRWENQSSMPDIVSLKKIAIFFNIKVDDLLDENAAIKANDEAIRSKKENYINNIAMLCLGVLTIWLAAVIIYVWQQVAFQRKLWQVWIWAIPLSALLIYHHNIHNRNIRLLNTFLLSIVAWGLCAGAYFQFIEYNFWQLFFLPIPLQAMIIIYTLFMKKTPKINKKQ